MAYQSPSIAYHTHSLDRHSHLKIFSLASTSSATANNVGPFINGAGEMSAPASPYRRSINNCNILQQRQAIPIDGENNSSINQFGCLMSPRYDSSNFSKQSNLNSIERNHRHLLLQGQQQQSSNFINSSGAKLLLFKNSKIYL